MGTLGNVDTLSAFLCLMVPLFYGTYLLSGRRLALIPMGQACLRWAWPRYPRDL